MRILVIADIHANLTALEAVLADARRRGKVDEIWCLGDVVGYGPDPSDCVRLIRETCSICIAGNHDLASIGKVSTADFNAAAAEAIVWTRQQLSQRDIDYLGELPLMAERLQFTLVHGSPANPVWEYVISTETASRNLSAFNTDFCLVGHTHVPMMFAFKGERADVEDLDNGTRIPLKKDRLILNPGAVGQPRDHDPRASYAIIDSDSNELSLWRVPYNIESVQKRMKVAGLPGRLIDRLTAGI